MFLTDRLQSTLQDTTIKAMDMPVVLLNVCIDYIKENTNAGMTVKELVSVIKRTNYSWKLFCKENGFRKSEDLFEKEYINKRVLMRMPHLKTFFND